MLYFFAWLTYQICKKEPVSWSFMNLKNLFTFQFTKDTCTYQLWGMYPSQTNKLFVLLNWESRCCVKEKNWRLLVLQTGNTEHYQWHRKVGYCPLHGSHSGGSLREQWKLRRKPSLIKVALGQFTVGRVNEGAEYDSLNFLEEYVRRKTSIPEKCK